ncbi:MAG: glycosyl transferase [Alphaproteobacteria bacterium]|nr:glycosyl transferase [Alphaproteobacteria bacterium]
MNASVLFYVQHLLGIGHMQRTFRIADAVAREGIGVTLVSGGEPPLGPLCTQSARIVQLAPIKARDATFKELVGPDGQPIDEKLQQARRNALLAAFKSARPDAVVIEAFPFGRRAFRFEIEALIKAARSRCPRPRILCSVRDIVVVPDDASRLREIVDRVRSDFDFVLVHGDPAFISLGASFSAVSEIADRLIYTGYIGDPDQAVGGDETVGANEVLVSVGGGAVGTALLSTALEARRRGCLASLTWRLLAGPNLPEPAFGTLADALPEDVVLERYRQEFPQMLRRCRVSVSQAGYNTILDILAAGARAVVVPFASERETEQQLRAERLAARGALEMIPEPLLTPTRLAKAVQRAIRRDPLTISVDTGGARRSARLIANIIRDPASVIGRTNGNFVSRSAGGIIGA